MKTYPGLKQGELREVFAAGDLTNALVGLFIYKGSPEECELALKGNAACTLHWDMDYFKSLILTGSDSKLLKY